MVIPNSKRCSHCGVDTVRVLWAERPRKDTSGTYKVWVDGAGRQWNGLQCPACKYSLQNPQRPFSSTKTAKTGRCCRRCGIKLDASHYFNCAVCLRGSDDEFSIYGHAASDGVLTRRLTYNGESQS